MSPNITKQVHVDLFVGEKCVGSRRFYIDNPSQLIYNQIILHFTSFNDIDLQFNTLQMSYINSEQCLVHCSCDDDILEGLMSELICLNMTLNVITLKDEYVEDHDATIQKHKNG